jgi:hypothetical protein
MRHHRAPADPLRESRRRLTAAMSRSILVKADQVADALNLDETLLDSLLVKLGLE